MPALTPYLIACIWLVCAGAGCWLGNSHRLQSRRRFARCDVLRREAVAPVRSELLLSHTAKFCLRKPLNTTQQIGVVL